MKRNNIVKNLQPIVLKDEDSDGENLETNFWISVTVSAPEIKQENIGYAYVSYLITMVDQDNQEHLIRKRYSELEELDVKLKNRFGKEMSICSFPPKTNIFTNNLGLKFVEKRRKGLELWLASILLNPTVSKCQEVDEFLKT